MGTRDRAAGDPLRQYAQGVAELHNKLARLLVQQQESISELLLIRERCRRLRETLGRGSGR